MSKSCGHETSFDGMSKDYRRRLWLVIFLNASMFVIEMFSGFVAHSQALKADALDFFADALTYGMSLAVIGKPIKTRALVALIKGFSLLCLGLWVLISTFYQVLMQTLPTAPLMGSVAFVALCVNVLCVLILVPYREGDSNVRSVWLCSRNDAIANILVMFAALVVWKTASAWPDLIAATLMAGLFLFSSVSIIRQALKERASVD